MYINIFETKHSDSNTDFLQLDKAVGQTGFTRLQQHVRVAIEIVPEYYRGSYSDALLSPCRLTTTVTIIRLLGKWSIVYFWNIFLYNKLYLKIKL